MGRMRRLHRDEKTFVTRAEDFGERDGKREWKKCPMMPVGFFFFLYWYFSSFVFSSKKFEHFRAAIEGKFTKSFDRYITGLDFGRGRRSRSMSLHGN